MALIIEEINRAHRVGTRYRMDGERTTIGRCYDNAVMVEDPHADPVHAEVVRDEDGCYVLRDLDSLNGMRLIRNFRDKSVKPTNIREHLIESGDEIQIGKSRLRFIDTEMSVPPAIPLHSAETVFDRLATTPVAVALCVLVAALSLWMAYLGSTSEFKWTGAVEVLTDAVLGLLIYAAAWAFIGKVVKHESHFLAHLSIAASAALLYAAWQWFGTLLNFNFSLHQVMPLLNILVLAILIPVMLWCAAYLALNIAPHWRLVASILLPWCFLGFAAAVEIGKMDEFSGAPEVSKELKSKDFLWRKPVPQKEFLASTPALFDIPIEKSKNKRGKSSSKTASDNNLETQGE
ncbi:FHA domain-containing protein [Microbulbifer hydrolyticus]|uniref:FHA domain-containing protein n=1 Tax=Microbulbifer hydrolyticus TaxID=48074 RepID=A0A6P1TBY7_9GAMM|nr:FHA domain-containing protein [Microbulbifer hydrolyticus]MBB5211007.1 pSer/pThr/pTyr-binding forkhead associated (FHA) protein [Microbulbifer hydrolyticus]QHQ38182.1 FHA domain-containing protein [Microbulbifer hydrolyticus]